MVNPLPYYLAIHLAKTIAIQEVKNTYTPRAIIK